MKGNDDMKTMEQFWNELTTNKELAEKLEDASAGQKIESFLRENEVDCTEEEFREYSLKKAKERGELSDEQIAEASGGSGYIDRYNELVELLSQYDDLKDKVDEINRQLARGNKSFFRCLTELEAMRREKM